jgi:hypothetical protein
MDGEPYIRPRALEAEIYYIGIETAILTSACIYA